MSDTPTFYQLLKLGGSSYGKTIVNRQSQDLYDRRSKVLQNTYDLHYAIIGLEHHVSVFLRVAVSNRILLYKNENCELIA